ncbi:MAG: hypothetical protein DF280_02565 ['Brassica napus' phytoplasma]|nr:MAG: hypothetical protein DF280_02565 ['Brassica napus' phytoplasma]
MFEYIVNKGKLSCFFCCTFFYAKNLLKILTSNTYTNLWNKLNNFFNLSKLSVLKPLNNYLEKQKLNQYINPYSAYS